MPETPPTDLPARFHPLIADAEAGTLPAGVHFLPSGLITDLNAYVLAWAECWPGDTAHITRRLGEALSVL